MGRVTRLGAIVALALAVAGCGIGAASNTHTLQLAAEEPGGIPALMVTITDESGHLKDAGQEVGWPGGVVPDGPTWNPPGAPSKVLVSWTGGACDTSVEMTLRSAGDGFAVAMKTNVKEGVCDSIGIGRAVMLTFDRPVAAALVAISG